MESKRPNILWYCTDQQRFDTIGALGNPHVDTPNIDKLLESGVAFTHAYCQSPICTPSRSSFLTGLYPARLHNTRNGNGTFPEFPPLITKLVSDAGYRCGNIGKFHLTSSGHRTEPRLDDGMTYWKFSHAPRDDWESGHHYADWVGDQGGDLDAMRNSPERVDPAMHQTRWATECAIEFTACESESNPQDADQPWMLCVNIYDPHPPFIPPKFYADQFDAKQMPGPYFQPKDLAQQTRLSAIDFQGDPKTPEGHDAKQMQAYYYAMIKQIDDQFQRIIEHLQTTNQLENTIIIFTSDHGESLGDHGLLEKGCRFYEGLVRVPLIFSCPAKFLQNVRREALVELLDLTSTIIELAGIEHPDYMQGRSLIPLLTNSDSVDSHREFVRSEYFDALDPFFTGGTGAFATMYRNRQFKLSVYHGHELGELYDLENDPWEFNDLWNNPEYATVKADLIAKSFDAHVLLTTDVGSERIAPM
jgi:arylsulfatase